MVKGFYLSFILDVELDVSSFFSEFFFRLAKVEGIMSFLQLAAWRTEFVNLFDKYFLSKANQYLWNRAFVFVLDVVLNRAFKSKYCGSWYKKRCHIDHRFKSDLGSNLGLDETTVWSKRQGNLFWEYGVSQSVEETKSSSWDISASINSWIFPKAQNLNLLSPCVYVNHLSFAITQLHCQNNHLHLCHLLWVWLYLGSTAPLPSSHSSPWNVPPHMHLATTTLKMATFFYSTTWLCVHFANLCTVRLSIWLFGPMKGEVWVLEMRLGFREVLILSAWYNSHPFHLLLPKPEISTIFISAPRKEKFELWRWDSALEKFYSRLPDTTLPCHLLPPKPERSTIDILNPFDHLVYTEIGI